MSSGRGCPKWNFRRC